MKIDPSNFTIQWPTDDGRLLVHNSKGERSIKRRPTFEGDMMSTSFKSASFLQEPKFIESYEAGINSGHKLNEAHGLQLQWRVHTCIWAAQQGLRLEGDFVECGVNTGIFSLALMKYLDFDEIDRNFYLFDTYDGIPIEQASKSEISVVEAHNLHYFDCFELASKNFAPFPNARLVKGTVPETLSQVDIEKVAYLSIDMNVAYPEIAAGEFFWDKLSKGAVVVLDDYGWANARAQRDAWDDFAQKKGTTVLDLPTGQGLLIK